MLQTHTIQLCNFQGKLIIIYLWILDSNIHNLHPTHTNSSNVANTVIDGSYVVILSGK